MVEEGYFTLTITKPGFYKIAYRQSAEFVLDHTSIFSERTVTADLLFCFSKFIGSYVSNPAAVLQQLFCEQNGIDITDQLLELAKECLYYG